MATYEIFLTEQIKNSSCTVQEGLYFQALNFKPLNVLNLLTLSIHPFHPYQVRHGCVLLLF